MAERYAVATGNWSDTATWDGGTLPGASDDVYTNSYTVTIDQDITVLSLNNQAGVTAVAGGGFTVSTSRTINADLTGGGNGQLLLCTGGTITITGDILQGNGGQFDGSLVINGATADVTFTGNIQDAGVPKNMVRVVSGSLSMIGDITVTAVSVNHQPCRLENGTFSITGNIYGTFGGTSSAGMYAVIHGGGDLTITGDVYGGAGTGLWSNSTGSLIINGDIHAGSRACGAVVTGNVTATYPYQPGIINPLMVHNGNLFDSSAGVNALLCSRTLISSSLEIQHRCVEDSSGSPGPARSLYTGGTNIGNPSAANVRSGTTFGPSNEYTGTLAIPSGQYVSLGVPVDSGVGTLAHLDASGIRSAIGLSSADLGTTLTNVQNNTNLIPGLF